MFDAFLDVEISILGDALDEFAIQDRHGELPWSWSEPEIDAFRNLYQKVKDEERKRKLY